MTKQADSLLFYFKELAKQAKPLSKREELVLAERIQTGDLEARRELIVANLKFAIRETRKFLHMGLSEEDLIQEANMAMIEAANRFKPEANCKFITYCRTWIQKYLNEAIVNKGKIVKYPMHKEIELYKRRVAGETISHNRSMEIDKPAGDDGKNTIGDLMLKSLSDVEHGHDVEHICARVQEAINALTDRERLIIEAFYGVGMEWPLHPSDIAVAHGITTTRVNQLRLKAEKQIAETLILD